MDLNVIFDLPLHIVAKMFCHVCNHCCSWPPQSLLRLLVRLHMCVVGNQITNGRADRNKEKDQPSQALTQDQPSQALTLVLASIHIIHPPVIFERSIASSAMQCSILSDVFGGFSSRPVSLLMMLSMTSQQVRIFHLRNVHC